MDINLEKNPSSLTNEDFSNEVERLWFLRREREFESSRILLNQISLKWFTDSRIPETVNELLKISRLFDLTSIVALVSFQCAELRSLHKISESDQKLDILEKFLLAIGNFNFFHYHIEHCQRELEKGNFHKSLLHASKMLEFSKSNNEKLVALIHKLICYENMGLEPHLVENQIFALKLYLNDSLILRQQWTAYLARKYFRSGNLQAYQTLRPQQPSGQEAFHMAWVYQIPYTKYFSNQELKEDTIQIVIKNSRSYLINTLLGIEDSNKYTPKMIERCDRLYLWTWRWITQTIEPRQSAYQLTLTLSDILTNFPNEDFTIEDRYLVTNSILWLSFFDREQRSYLLNLAQRFQPQFSKGYELFELEYHIISYFIAKDSLNKFKMNFHMDKIKRNPIRESPLLILLDPEGVKNKNLNQEMIQLKDQINITFQLKTLDSIQVNECLINTHSGEIRIKDKKKINSLILTKAIRYLYWNKDGALPFENFCEQVFSRENLHSSNLKSRTHSILSQISKFFDKKICFHFNDNMISQVGFWPDICFIESSILSEEISKVPKLEVESSLNSEKKILRKKSRSLKSLVVAIQSKPGISRSELQDILKVPKTTLRRMILQASNEQKIHSKTTYGLCRYYPTVNLNS